jgi:hypothetical protein
MLVNGHTVPMRGSLRLLVAWVAATVVAVVIATAAVGSVRSQVTEAPTPLSSPDAAALVSAVISPSAPETGGTVVESAPATTTTILPTTAAGSSTTNPSDAVGGTSTTTTRHSTSSTVPTTRVPSVTTTAPSTSYTKTFDTEAGSIRVVVDGNAVTFGGAYPKSGWGVDLEDDGPAQVKVKFERISGEGEIEFTARVDEGELKVDIDDHEADEG